MLTFNNYFIIKLLLNRHDIFGILNTVLKHVKICTVVNIHFKKMETILVAPSYSLNPKRTLENSTIGLGPCTPLSSSTLGQFHQVNEDNSSYLSQALTKRYNRES